MSKPFNPRYKFTVAEGHIDMAVSLHGIRSDDLEAILVLAEEHMAQPSSPNVTGVEEHRYQVARTIAAIRERATHVNGFANIVFDKGHYGDMSWGNVQSVLTSASLGWGDKYDPDNTILVRMSKHNDAGAPPPADIVRLYHTMTILHKRSDEPRMKRYGSWEGPKRGSFAPVISMDPKKLQERIKEAKSRRDWNRKMDRFFREMFGEKDQAKKELV